MNIKRYFAADMRQAIRLVREEQGPDAVILSNRKVDGGVEIVAAIDYDEALVEKMAREQEAVSRRPEPVQQKPEVAPSVPESPVEAPAAATEAESRLAETIGLTSESPAESAATDAPPPRREAAPQAQPEEKMRVVWSQEPALVAMREELQTLRGIMESQLSGLAWGEEGRSHPFRAKLLERMLQLGLAPALCRELADQVACERDAEHNWRQALGLLARRLPVTDDDILNHGGVVAMVGATGVGKTTTLAKLAARYTLRHGRDRVALVTTDSYRIGAHHQLRTYGRILGAPVYAVRDAAELQTTLERLRERELVLIDTAGAAPRDMRLLEQFALLRGGGPRIRSYLVLGATTQRTALEATINAFSDIELQGCILTKVDESMLLGESLSVVAQHRLPVAYVGDGQRVPEDLHPARANKLVSRSVALMRDHTEAPPRETLAFAFGQPAEQVHG